MSFNGKKPETISRMECQLIRDFCASAGTLLDQFERFQRSGSLSYSALRDLLGVSDNRGSLWRLKDAAHILFSRPDNQPGQLLDRTIGTIFHECIKLMEATYQSQHYVNACELYIARNLAGSEAGAAGKGDSPLTPDEEEALAESAESLLNVLKECADDVRHGITRMGRLFEVARPLICICFTGKGSNQMLVKYLAGRSELMERTMGRHYQEFMQALDLEQRPNFAPDAKFASRFALTK